MGITNWLLGRPAEAESRALTRETVPASFFPGDGTGPVVGERTALMLADVFACVRVLSHTCASVPLLTYRRTDEGRERWMGPPTPLLRTPAPAVTGSSLIATTVAHLATTGDAFLGVFRDQDGIAAQLAPLDPSQIVVEILGGLPLYVYTDPTGRQMTLGHEDVVHVRMLSLDGVTGRSPIAACRDALGLNAALATHARATFENGALPAGVLTVQAGPTAQDTMDNLRTGWNARHQGPANRGRVAVVSGDVGWQPVSMTLADSDFVRMAELSTRQVCRVFGVPAWSIEGETAGSMTYSNVSEQKRALLDLSCQPYLTQIEDAISAHPALHETPETYSEFERAGWLQSDPKGAR
jgi:HK97 family phage portal protein